MAKKKLPPRTAQGRKKVVTGSKAVTTSNDPRETALPRKAKRKSNKANGKPKFTPVTAMIRRDNQVVEQKIPAIEESKTLEESKTIEPQTKDCVTLEAKTVVPLRKKSDDTEVGFKENPPEIADAIDQAEYEIMQDENTEIVKAPTLTPERAKEIRKLRKHYGKRLPPVVCDNCAYAQQCAQFKAGYECAFMNIIDNTKIESISDIENAQKRIIEANLTTAELGLIQQRLQGGIIDDATSSRLDAAFEQLSEMRRLQMQVLTQSTETISVSGPGIIEKLFGSLNKTPQIETIKQVDVIQVKEKDPKETEFEVITVKDQELSETIERFSQEE